MKIFGFYRDNIKDVDADTKVQTEKITDEDIIRFITAGVLRLTIDATGIAITNLTTGSVLFAGAGGLISQDNANYFWDDVNKRLGIGTASPTSKLTILQSSDDIVGGLSLYETTGTYNGGIFRAAGANGALVLRHAGVDALTIGGGAFFGRIGVGTSTPASLFHIKGTDHTFLHVEAPSGKSAGWKFREGGSDKFYLSLIGSDDTLRIYDYGDTSFPFVVKAGKVGIGTITPTLPLDVKAKSGMSALGGICIKLTNKTGSNTIAGQLVQAGTATDDSFILSGVDETENIGVVLDSGIGDGNEAWLVISGIADVAMKDDTAATRGNWVKASSEAGYGDSTNATPPGGGVPELDEHMREVGNCIENVVAGGGGVHILARCVLHFN